MDEARRKKMGGRTAGKGAVDRAVRDAEPGLRVVASRLASAEEKFIEFAMKTGKMSRADAEKALATMKQHKVVKIDSRVGQFTFKHGAFAEPDVLRRAAGLDEHRMTPAKIYEEAAACEALAALRPVIDAR